MIMVLSGVTRFPDLNNHIQDRYLMKNHFDGFRKSVICIFLFALAIMLSACGSSGNLFGSAGLSTETPLSTLVPTEIPIPDTYGHIIYVSDRDGQMNLYMTTPDGTQQTRLTTSLTEDIDPQISPDGRRVAFVSTVDNNVDIYILDLSTSRITRITDAPEKDSSPSWSADGTQIAFESFRDGNLEIYMVSADGSNTIRLTDDPAGDSHPIWSPVSNEIAFVSNRFGNADVLLLTPNGSVSTLTTNVAPDSDPAWSPDGNTIAFRTSSGELSDLCLINRDGLNQHCLTPAPSEYGPPVWSPDGKSIAVRARGTTGHGIEVFNIIDNTKQEMSLAGVEPLGDLVWSPEGARLAFQAQVGGDMELYVAVEGTNEFARLTSSAAYDGQPVWTSQ
jgi:TolB protein